MIRLSLPRLYGCGASLDVVVHPSLRSLRAMLATVNPTVRGAKKTLGFFQAVKGERADYLGVIHVTRKTELFVVAHEATHAACWWLQKEPQRLIALGVQAAAAGYEEESTCNIAGWFTQAVWQEITKHNHQNDE